MLERQREDGKQKVGSVGEGVNTMGNTEATPTLLGFGFKTLLLLLRLQGNLGKAACTVLV